MNEYLSILFIPLYSTFPLQPAWPHLQSTSGVDSIASHWTLQYFPLLALQVQGG